MKCRRKLTKEAQMIQEAVARTLDGGFRTKDIMTPAGRLITTVEMGKQVIEQLDKMNCA